MSGRSDERQGTPDESRGWTVEDAAAEERATDEGMPEAPETTRSEAPVRSDMDPSRGPVASHVTGSGGGVKVDEFEEDGGGYDLGGGG